MVRLDVDLLKISTNFLDKVTKNQKVMDRQTPHRYKCTFTKVPPFIITVSKHIVINYANS